MSSFDKSYADELNVISDPVLKSILNVSIGLSSVSLLSDPEKISKYSSSELELSLKMSSISVHDLLNNICTTFDYKPSSHISGSILALLPFAHRTEMLLSHGGDDRLTINMNNGGVNKYFSSTIPRDAMIKRGSCTCSSISTPMFKIADSLRIRMLHAVVQSGHSILPEVNENIRYDLSSLFQLNNGLNHSVITCPSGSDAELIPVCIAIIQRQNYIVANKLVDVSESSTVDILNIVTAAGEVGSGTPNASAGQHFSSLAPKGHKQSNSKDITGLVSKVKIVEFKPRGADGQTAFREIEIAALIRTTLASDQCSVAILHSVCGSKTGLVYPSLGTVKALQSEFGSRLIVVMDLCQLRTGLSKIREFIELGYICLVTGSKFFTGPPFSGAVILPGPTALAFETHLSDSNQANWRVPAGLADYLTPDEIPSNMPNLKRFVTRSGKDVWTNVGLTLRWACAIDTMKRYAALSPTLVAAFTASWAEQIKQYIGSELGPYVHVFPVSPEESGAADGFDTNSIVSISVNVEDPTSNSFRPLNVDELKVVFEKMTRGPGPVMAIGQPVKLGDKVSVVRIALGADVVLQALEGFSSDPLAGAFRVSQILSDDKRLLQKLSGLAKGWNSDKSDEQRLLKRMRQIDRTLWPVTAAPTSEQGLNPGSTTLARVSAATRALLSNTTAEVLPDVAVLYDFDALHGAVAHLTNAFDKISNGGKSLHCFAVKSCPVSHILHTLIGAGLGMETASLMEVRQALRCGAKPGTIVFDSPCKTRQDIEFAMRRGVSINANSLTEIDLMADVYRSIEASGVKVVSVLGVRVNPIVGPGKILALSTATLDSKFGIPLTPETKAVILQAYQQHSFLTCLMCHVGSQGVPMSAMVEGAAKLLALADEVEALCGADRISTIDIGGGLSANYSSDAVSPAFDDYAEALRVGCPGLNRPGRTLVTEFGKALIAKTGAVVALVEDVLTAPVADAGQPLKIAVIHAGADLFMRTAYCPDKFSHRVHLCGPDGSILTDQRPSCAVTVAGPLCFSGDIIASKISLPNPMIRDRAVMMDAGANTLSLFSRHCSRPAPAVFGFRTDPSGSLLVTCVKSRETDESLFGFWDGL